MYSQINNKKRNRINTIERQINKISFTIHCKDFAFGLSKEIKKICNVCCGIYYDEKYDRYDVYINGQEKIRTFLDCIYKESNIYLDRKYCQYLYYILPSDLEINQIVNAKLSENILPDL